MQTIVEVLHHSPRTPANPGERLSLDSATADQLIAAGLVTLVRPVFDLVNPTLATKYQALSVQLVETHAHRRQAQAQLEDLQQDRVDSIVEGREDTWKTTYRDAEARVVALEERAALLEVALRQVCTLADTAAAEAQTAYIAEARVEQYALLEQLDVLMEQVATVNAGLRALYRDACAQLRTDNWLGTQGHIGKYYLDGIEADARQVQTFLHKARARIGADAA